MAEKLNIKETAISQAIALINYWNFKKILRFNQINTLKIINLYGISQTEKTVN